MSQSLVASRPAEKPNQPILREKAELAGIPPDVLKLNATERMVCALIVSGLANKEIASHLGAGLRTVELCRHNAARKLELGRTPLIVWATRNAEWLPTVTVEGGVA
jgi:FixJ family two-component response regulator